MVMVGRRKKAWRRGTTAVETAIVFPLLLLLTLGAMRYGWLFLKAQQITNAARVAVRVAVRPGATTTDVEAYINALFGPDRANITGHTVSFYRTELDSATGLPLTDPNGNLELTPITDLYQDLGVPITVRITVPCANVDIMRVNMFTKLDPNNGDWDLGAAATMAKEGT